MKKTNVVLSLAAAIALTACGGGGGGGGGGSTSSAIVTPSSAATSVVASSAATSVVASSVATSVAPSSVAASSAPASSEAASSSAPASSSSLASSSASSVDFTSCTNFNTVQGYAAQGNGVTGGADAGLGNNTVTVTTGAELNNVLSATNATYKDKPLIVYIGGHITWANSNNAEIRIRRNNVSIIGMPDSGEISGVGFHVSHGASNIIFRNLKMHEVPQTNGSSDHIHLDGQDGAVSNIWIDHNEFYNDLTVDKDFYDELVSGRSAVHNVTISYNYLHDSQKTSLWGSSDDSVAENVGRTISFHHNHWKDVVSRLPLFRFGEGHIWNNYYQNVTGSGINSRMGAKIRIDNNVFESVKNPILSIDSPNIGYWNATGNSFTSVTWGSTPVANCSTPPCYAGNNDSVTDPFVPPYTYNAMPTADVKTHVTTYAGRNKINSCLSLPEASSTSSSSVSSSSSSAVSATTTWDPSYFDFSSYVGLLTAGNYPFNATATPINVGGLNLYSASAGSLRLYQLGATGYGINYNGTSLKNDTEATPVTFVEGSSQVTPTLLNAAGGVSRYVSVPLTPVATPVTLTVSYSNASNNYDAVATPKGCLNGQVAIVDQSGQTRKVASSCGTELSTLSVTITDSTVSELFILMSRNGDGGGGIRIWSVEITK